MAAYFITTIEASKVLSIRMFEQLRGIISYLLFALAAGAISYYLEDFVVNDYIKIILSTVLFLTIYVLLIFSFKRTEVMNYKRVIR